jgi:hypothetical protein
VSEQEKRLAVPGPRGEQGQQGETGETGAKGAAGLPISVGRSIVALFVLMVLLAAANFLWSAAQQRAYQDSLAREHAAHIKADQILVAHLCLTFGDLGALKPPPGDPAKNPSRAYDDKLHATLIQLGTDLGCKVGD